MKKTTPATISEPGFITRAVGEATGKHFVSREIVERLEQKPHEPILSNPPGHWYDSIASRRNEPGFCRQCSKPNDRTDRTVCTICKDKGRARYHELQRRKFIEELVDGGTTKKEWLTKLAHMLKRIESLENALARVQLRQERDRKAVWKMGYNARKQKEQAQGAWKMPVISKQEAATINHAFARKS
jgi:hypothetical protein